MDNRSLNNGHIIEVTPDMFEKAAMDFSEGNEALKKLLLFCFKNGIKTTGCCSGHEGKKRPYIQLEFSDKNIKAIIKLLKMIPVKDAIKNFAFIKQPGVTSNFCISMDNDRYDEGFEQILEALQYEEEIEMSDLDANKQLMLKTLQNHNIENRYLEFQESETSVSIGVGEEYLSTLSAGKKTIPWTEETRLTEYSKDSNDLTQTLYKLESRSKNITYLNEHPYDQESINKFWKDKDRPAKIEMNPSATIERKYEYGEANVAVINVLPGSSIESIANEIMQLNQHGQACITRFNSFEIDSRDYKSADEIIRAYMNEYEKHRMKRQASSVTIEGIREATDEVRISEINGATREIKAKVREEREPKGAEQEM